MNEQKHSRYEQFQTSSGTRYYDRRNHSVTENIVSEDTVILKQKDICVLSFYPHKLLSHIRIHPLVIDLAIIWIMIGYIRYSAYLGGVVVRPRECSILYAVFAELSILFFSIFLHEMSHGMAAVSMGAFVAEIGVMKAKFGFQYFTKVIWDGSSKWEKMRFFFSGIAMNMFLSVIGMILFFKLDWQYGFLLYLTNTFFTVVNLLPVKCMNSDGYHMLQLVWLKNDK